MTWLSPLAFPMPKQPEPEPEESGHYIGKVNTGRRGTPVKYQGITYRSIRGAATAHGMTVQAMRWALLHKRTK